jgi:hypothetical protein
MARKDWQDAQACNQEAERLAKAKTCVAEVAVIMEGLKQSTDSGKIKQGLENIKMLVQTACQEAPKYDFYTYEMYRGEIDNYDPQKEFCPNLFCKKLSFPEGTMSAVGARTGRGKTTALVNLALEAIENNRGCLFVNFETGNRPLINKLILLRAYCQAEGSVRSFHLDKVENTFTELYRAFKADARSGHQASSFKRPETDAIFGDKIREADVFIRQRMQEGLIKFPQARKLNQQEIADLILLQKKGALVLIDYIQRMPEGDIKEGFQKIKQASNVVLNAAIDSGVVAICGAQFNRGVRRDAKGNKTSRDNFDDASFRESGDIEQDAHNAIGIGSDGNGKDGNMFVQFIKVREGPGAGSEYKLEHNLAYSYMKMTEEKYEGARGHVARGTRNGTEKNKKKEWHDPRVDENGVIRSL